MSSVYSSICFSIQQNLRASNLDSTDLPFASGRLHSVQGRGIIQVSTPPSHRKHPCTDCEGGTKHCVVVVGTAQTSECTQAYATILCVCVCVCVRVCFKKASSRGLTIVNKFDRKQLGKMTKEKQGGEDVRGAFCLGWMGGYVSSARMAYIGLTELRGHCFCQRQRRKKRSWSAPLLWLLDALNLRIGQMLCSGWAHQQ